MSMSAAERKARGLFAVTKAEGDRMTFSGKLVMQLVRDIERLREELHYCRGTREKSEDWS